MSEPLIQKVISNGGVNSLIFLLLRNIAHLKYRHTVRNILEQNKYGDVKKQLFLFETGYTGFDALFIDYYTNQRYKIDQELEVDLFALNMMREIGIDFNLDDYRNILKII